MAESKLGTGERAGKSRTDPGSGAATLDRLALDRQRERAHLYALARVERPPLDHAPGEVVDPSLERVLRSLSDSIPAYVLGRRWDILAWNRGACELLANFRGTVARHADLPEVQRLVRRLSDTDPQFATWRRLFESVLSPTSDDQRLILYTDVGA